MEGVKLLTELTLSDHLREFKAMDPGQFWADLKEQTLKAYRVILERSLQEDLVVRLGAPRYSRNPDRRGWRNGFYQRNLTTELGLIEGLRIPRSRQGMPRSNVLDSFSSKEAPLRKLVRGMYLGGMSTRGVAGCVTKVIGSPVSSGSVSRIVAALDSEVGRFLSRKLEDKYKYLFLDGVTMRVRAAGKVKKKLVLTAVGITIDNKREIISYRQATTESENEWETFLNDLFRRGLEGKSLKLVICDGCAGLRKAADTVYAYTRTQLCWAHKMRNVADKTPRRLQREVLGGAKRIYTAKNLRGAVKAFKEWAHRWRSDLPAAVRCIETDLEELTNFFKCPEQDRKKVRTTNGIERLFREVRRRTRPITSFPNGESCNRVLYGIFAQQNQIWVERFLSSANLHN